MVSDQEHSFHTSHYAGSIVLSQERQAVEFRIFPFSGPRIYVFPFHGLSPEVILAPASARQQRMLFWFAVVSAIMAGSVLGIGRLSNVGFAFFSGSFALMVLLMYLSWRESRIRWYTFFFLDAGPSFAFPETRGAEEKTKEFALQIQNAIREYHVTRQALWDQAVKQSTRR